MTGARQPRRLEDFGPLFPAEEKVLQELDTGHVTVLGDGTLPPPDAGPDRRLRARFVRWCALGAGDGWRVHETGLRVQGALIVSDGEADPTQGATGTAGLDLEGCKVEHDLGFMDCRFEDPLLFRSARLAGLFLIDSRLPGLSADRLTMTGDLVLRGANVEGEARLVGARIGGDLSCEGATLRNEGGKALNADGLTTTGGVFLRGAHVEGEAGLPGARIGGNLECDGATLRNVGGKALIADGCAVTGAFFWRKGASTEGEIDLTAAEIGVINDDPDCWPGAGDLALNRCRYGAFTGKGIDGEARIRWLGLQDPSRYRQDFWPQPWEHCAKVLREMGHPEDARLVLIDKERRQRADRRRKLSPWARRFAVGLDFMLDQTIRFGRRPLRAGLWLALLWLVGGLGFFAAWQGGAMKPANAFVLRSAEWVECAAPPASGATRRADAGETQLACFLRQPQGASYPEFNAFIYAADVLFPLVEIEQQAHWTPDEDKPGGLAAKWLMYAKIILGWALSLLAVAGFSGLVKSD